VTVSNGTVLASRVFVAASTGSAGTLTIVGGAMNLSSNMVVGSTSTGTVFATGTVWMKGGQLVVTNAQMDVGLDGLGTMVVSNGAVVARDVFVNASSVGTLTTSTAQGNLTMVGGTLTAFSSLVIGDCATGGGTGMVRIAGGSLFVTNNAGNATLDVRGGTLILDSGVLNVDRLVMTNSCGRIVWNGGSVGVGTEILDSVLDADGDGLPNGWEQTNGLDPLSVAGNNGPNGDPDGDGKSNLQEYSAGTSPINSASALRIVSVAREGSDIRITWTTVGNKSYLPQFMPINTANYTNAFTDFNIPAIVMPPGGESTTNYLDVGAATNAIARYYRVRLGP
jgi:hypothetical protein